MHALRLSLILSAVGALLYAAPSVDLFSALTQQVIVSAFQSLGVTASVDDQALHIAHLEIPWTRDCSGINLVAVLLALTLWVTRNETPSWKWWSRLMLAFPAALLANVLRVFTLIATRYLLYPGVESPQLHYFIGFVWLVPMAWIITAQHHAASARRLLDMTHAAAVLAWLIPILAATRGYWSAAAALLLLSHGSGQTRLSQNHVLLAIGWLMGGLAIGAAGLESLWLPWLLTCPLLWDLKKLFHPSVITVLAATHPLVLIQQHGHWPAAGALLWAIGSLRTRPQLAEDTQPPSFGRLGYAVATLSLCLPFTASSFLNLHHQPCLPPEGLVIHTIGGYGYELRLPDEAAPVRLVWYASQSGDRHHSVKVCLKYRGSEVENVEGEPDVYCDASNWLSECFLQEDKLFTNYADYALGTLMPRAHPGAHLIFVAPKESMSVDGFKQKTAAAMSQLKL